jgi:hypothetical protein
MDPELCNHKNLRQIDNLRVCMSRGESWHLLDLMKSVTDDSGHGLSHINSNLQLNNGTAIRLVILIAGESHDPICCTMATVDFYSERYEAVSYTWATDGDDRKTGRILFSDDVMAVPENCEAVLRQLRSRSEPRQVWVDARCINQTNLEERSHQVSIMGQIYRMAATV